MIQDSRICQNCKTSFTIEPEDSNFYDQLKVPPPTRCPECRMRRRIVFRNERKLFRNKNGLTGESIISLYPPESGYTVYEDKYWWSDQWDPLAYGQDFDPNVPFLQQLYDLNLKVPKYRSASISMVNSEYSANAEDLKNCYLLFNSNHVEDSGYGNGVDFSKNCYDNSHIQKSERCYGSFWLTNCYETHFSSQCEDCANVWLLKNCRGCSNCIGCVNLRTQKYCIFNQQYSKEEYESKLKEMKLYTWSGFSIVAKEAKEFWLKFPIKYLQGVQNVNVSGEFITQSKNIYKSYLIRNSENLRYCQYSQVPSSRDCMDGSLIGSQSELLYESSICGWRASNLKFCWECWDDVRNLEYCLICSHGASDLFGCVGVKKSRYCILNKQYTPEKYKEMVETIKEHMNKMPYVDKQGRVYRYGEFLPPEFSPLNYNDTIAPEHFPATKDEVLKFGSRFEEINAKEYETTLKAEAIPDSIQDVLDSILKEIIQCEKCKRAYRIIQSELQFLKQLSIPAPRTCVDCRHASRINQRNQAKFYEKTCDCSGQTSSNQLYANTAKHVHNESPCSNQFETSYSPARPEIVYCESCYNSEVS